MTRTVWGAHKRYMDTYFNVYKGYYVCATAPSTFSSLTDLSSSLVMELAVITKATIGFVAALTMS